LIREGQVSPHCFEFDHPIMKSICERKLKDHAFPKPAIFQLMCASLYGHADVIVTHSNYAAAKLRLETAPHIKLPKLLIMRHPDTERATHPNSNPQGKSGQFRVGVFGWISETKRPASVVAAFKQLIARVAAEGNSDPEKLKLVFVGQIAERQFAPAKLAAEFGIEPYVESHGYVSEAEFNRLMSTVDILVNLRFLSCGESSGTQSLAKSFNIDCIVSDYQAFHEEPAYGKVRIDHEVDDLAALLYKKWREKNNVQSPSSDVFIGSAFKKMTALECFEMLHEMATDFKGFRDEITATRYNLPSSDHRKLKIA
jgi:hypothetical protein